MDVDDDARPLFRWRLGRTALIALDAVAAAGYTIVLVALTLVRGAPVPSGIAVAVLAAMGLPLAVRRVWPLPVFALVLVASGVSVALGVAQDSFVAAAYALYVVALTRPRPRWEPIHAIAVVTVVGGLGTGLASPRAHVWVAAALSGLTALGAAWTLGRIVRDRRAAAVRDAERMAAQAVTEERLRIARELHDVVAHSTSLITVKAGVAHHLAASRPEEAREALGAIETIGRGALEEMRRLLGVLRSGAGEERRPAPMPTLVDLPALVRRTETAGVRVELETEGLDGLPEGVQLSVYRIVQEAMTNVVRHAAPACCRVTIRADGTQVRVDVVDDGPGRRVLPDVGAPPGHGLLGMRERVAMYGGVLTAGVRQGGGFQVSARLPYRAGGEPA